MVVEVQKLAETGREVRISRKISADDFLGILERRPSKIVISASILNQSKSVKLMVETIRTTITKGAPEIEIVSRGGTPRRIKQDWVDPFIRSLVGHRPDPEGRLLVHILDSGKSDITISQLTPSEIELLPRLEKLNEVELTKDLRVKLTKLGATLARGTKKLYPEFWG